MMADTAKVVDLINNAKQMVTEAVDRLAPLAMQKVVVGGGGCHDGLNEVESKGRIIFVYDCSYQD
jgi:hypothetical protein